MRRRTLLALALAPALGLCGPASAQNPDAVRVRGTIQSVDAAKITVATREGGRTEVTLPDAVRVSSVKAVDLASVQPGAYVGISAAPGKDGTLRALEVHVLPEALRGAGEGQTPWDLTPTSSMTNGTVAGAVQASAGRELEISYKGSTARIVVPPEVPVVTFIPADRADLRTGVPVIVFAVRQPDGGLVARAVSVGKDGVAPPM